MGIELETLRTMRKFGWSRAFSTEYALARQVFGLGHDGAIRAAKKSQMIRRSDIPRGV